MSSMTFTKPGRNHDTQQGRADLGTARLIDQCIDLQACHGTFWAALLLRDKNIDIEIALRVLLYPARHRNIYPPAMFQPRRYAPEPALIYTHTYT